MPKQELLGEVKKLISLGKEKGFLTYDDLNSTLPAEVVSSEQFTSIMTMFGEMDIEIVESPRPNDRGKPAETDDAIEEAEEAEGWRKMKRKSISLLARSAAPTTRFGCTSRRWAVWRC